MKWDRDALLSVAQDMLQLQRVYVFKKDVGSLYIPKTENAYFIPLSLNIS